MEVARDLRIRHVYIEAIEAGRLDDLPGLAYQTGFLRAYGNYLGLDGAALADRLRTERDSTSDRAELQVFSPVDEGHLPTRSVLLIAAVLAIAVYGAWYFFVDGEGDPMERVAALPDRLVSLIEGEPDDAAVAAAPERAAAKPPPPEPQRTARLGDDAGVSGNEAAVTARTEPLAPTPEPDAGTPPPEPAPAAPSLPPAPPREEADEAGPPQPPPARPSLEPVAEEPVAEEPVAEEPVAEEPVAEEPAAPVPAPPPPPVEEPVAAAEPPPAAAAAADAGARLVLRALTDSWIEIRAGDEPPLFSGLLRTGESYAVPPTRGLTMVTGNAGGLEVLVDGQALPSLGPQGAVMRDIDLDGLRRRESG